MPVPPVTSVQPEAPDNLLEALRGTSIVDEHRVLMDTVKEKLQFIKRTDRSLHYPSNGL